MKTSKDNSKGMKTAIEILETAIRKKKEDLQFVNPLTLPEAKTHKQRIEEEISDIERALTILNFTPSKLNLPPIHKKK